MNTLNVNQIASVAFEAMKKFQDVTASHGLPIAFDDSSPNACKEAFCTVIQLHMTNPKISAPIAHSKWCDVMRASGLGDHQDCVNFSQLSEAGQRSWFVVKSCVNAICHADPYAC